MRITGDVAVSLIFPALSFKTNLIADSREPIYATFFQSEGILSMLKDSNITEEIAVTIHVHALECLDASIKFYKKIDSIKSYLDNSVIEMVEKTVDNYYEVESYIRNIAYNNRPIDKGDEFINEIASKLYQYSY